MSWTSGIWADVAIGDTVLGGDGYPWSVTGGAINRFGVSGKGESLQVTMERDGAGARTGDVFADKPVKYRATEAGGRYLLSCIYCLRSDVEDPCKLHAPEPATKTCPGCSNPLPAGHKFPYCSPCIDEAEVKSTCKHGSIGLRHFWDADPSDPCYRAPKYPEEMAFAFDGAPRPVWTQRDYAPDGPVTEVADGVVMLAVMEPVAPATVEPAPAAPYVEYSDAERMAAASLKGAGFTMEVIERVMTLDGLSEHLEHVHGEPSPAFLNGPALTRVELRARLADLHFDLHLRDQERNRKWEPRGRTPHVHPVMDRPMDVG